MAYLDVADKATLDLVKSNTDKIISINGDNYLYSYVFQKTTFGSETNKIEMLNINGKGQIKNLRIIADDGGYSYGGSSVDMDFYVDGKLIINATTRGTKEQSSVCEIKLYNPSIGIEGIILRDFNTVKKIGSGTYAMLTPIEFNSSFSVKAYIGGDNYQGGGSIQTVYSLK